MKFKFKLLDIFHHFGDQRNKSFFPTFYRHNLMTGTSIEIRCCYLTVFISSALERKYEKRSQNNSPT